MKLNKILILFISIFLFSIEALSNGNSFHGINAENYTTKQLHFKKTESKEINFFNFLFEEETDSSENEDDSETDQILFDFPNDSKFFTRNLELQSKLGVSLQQNINSALVLPIFILFQNFRL